MKTLLLGNMLDIPDVYMEFHPLWLGLTNGWLGTIIRKSWRPYNPMKTKRFSLSLSSLCLLLVLLASSNGQEEYNQERYRLIIERSPFGKEEVAAPAVTDRQQQQIEERVEQQLRLCLLSESEATGEMFAGFQNLRAGAGDPKSVTLMVGESYQSMKLVEIDLDQSSATMEYMNNKITMNMAAPTQPAPNQRRLPNARNTRNTTTNNRRFGGRLQAQEPPEPELSAEEQAARLAEIRARLQEQQMDIIRKGQPPLPIPLSPEQDDQLVNEGFLEPVQ